MNLLLTGGLGYIGSHVATVLHGEGHNILIYDNLSAGQLKNLDRIESIIQDKIIFINGDVRDTNLLASILKEHEIEAVLHFAGLKSIPESIKDPLQYYSNNVSGTISVLSAMEKVGVDTFLFSSSATVYGAPQYLPIDESHPTTALNPYGNSKLTVEEILRDLSNASTIKKIVALRYFNPVGAHPSGLIGEDVDFINPSNLMPTLSLVAKGVKSSFKIYGGDYHTPDGTGIRDYIHVMDLAEGHLAALEWISNVGGYEIFNIGTGRGYSVIELCKEFQKASKVILSYEIVEKRVGDVASCYADVSKANKVLKWVAKRNISDMCRDTWKWCTAVDFAS